MPVKKEIIYPIFLECQEFCQDIFWSTIFEELSYGKAPYGTYISKGFLCCSYKGKQFSYKIERKDPKILHDDIINLLTTKLGILSQKEKLQKNILFHNMEKSIKENRQEWTTIRKKTIRNILYERYVIDMKNKHNLSIHQCRYLLSVLIIATMFKNISSKDINFVDDRIQNIDGITFTDNDIHISDNIISFDYENVDQLVERELMINNWYKYLKNL